jgi:hypothetical protein
MRLYIKQQKLKSKEQRKDAKKSQGRRKGINIIFQAVVYFANFHQLFASLR